MLLVELCKYVYYIFVVYVHTAFCNLIGVWKFLNRDKPDEHDSPDLSLFLSRRGWCARLVVNAFLVTLELTKACGRVVIFIHYSIILPQHILYMNISWTNHRQDVDINLGN